MFTIRRLCPRFKRLHDGSSKGIFSLGIYLRNMQLMAEVCVNASRCVFWPLLMSQGSEYHTFFINQPQMNGH